MPTPQTAGNVEQVNRLRNLSFAEARIKASLDDGEGVRVNSFKGVSWKATVAVGTGYGADGQLVARSSGQISYTNSVILRPDGMVRLYQRLAAIAAEQGLIRDGNRHQVGMVEWDLILSFRIIGQDLGRTIVFHKCRIIDDDETAGEGEALLESTKALHVMDQWEQDPENQDICWVLR